MGAASTPGSVQPTRRIGRPRTCRHASDLDEAGSTQSALPAIGQERPTLRSAKARLLYQPALMPPVRSRGGAKPASSTFCPSVELREDAGWKPGSSESTSQRLVLGPRTPPRAI